jgi:hypothetical protein
VLCDITNCSLTLTFLGPCIFHSTSFSNVCNICSSLKAGHHVSCPYKTSGKIIVFHMLVVLCVIMESGRDVTVLFLLNNFGHLQK